MKIVDLKGSKSIINRIITMSLYQNINITINNVNLCDDVVEMLDILTILGKHYTIKGDVLEICKEKPTTLMLQDHKLGIRNAGTVLRFVLPYLAFAEYNTVVITLGDRLSQRPITSLVDCLNKAGANIVFDKNLIIIKKNNYTKNSFMTNSSETSQFLSSLIMYATTKNTATKIYVDKLSKSVSQAYIQMTIDLLSFFNIDIKISGNEIYVIPDSTKTIDKIEFTCDPDYSTASYYWLYSYLLKKEVAVKKITNIHQPDYAFIEVLKQLNIPFKDYKDYIAVDVNRIDMAPYEISIDMVEMPDQIITLSFLALFAGIKIKISGCQTLAHKESNRLDGIRENIALLGGKTFYSHDVLTIFPYDKTPKPIVLKTYNDHRFAMTFLVLKERYPCIEIDNTECISKSVNIKDGFLL